MIAPHYVILLPDSIWDKHLVGPTYRVVGWHARSFWISLLDEGQIELLCSGQGKDWDYAQEPAYL